MRSSFEKQLARTLGATALAGLFGCSGLSPQIFSERLMVPSGAEGTTTTVTQPPKTLDEAYADAAHVQSLYLTAVRDQGNLIPRLSAGLLGLSAVALYQGLTSPSTDSLAAFGALGAAAFGYGRLVASPTRLDVYRAGAEALSCAMGAVEPLRVGQARLGQAGDDPTKSTLYGAIAQVRQQRNRLEALLDRDGALLVSATEAVPGRAGSARTVKRRAPACNPPPKGTPPEVALALKAQCERQPTVEAVITIPRTEPSTITRSAPAGLRG